MDRGEGVEGGARGRRGRGGGRSALSSGFGAADANTAVAAGGGGPRVEAAAALLVGAARGILGGPEMVMRSRVRSGIF